MQPHMNRFTQTTPSVLRPFGEIVPHQLLDACPVATPYAEQVNADLPVQDSTAGTVWFNQLCDQEVEAARAKAERAAAYADRPENVGHKRHASPDLETLTLAAIAKAEKLRRDVLTNVGLRKFGDPPFDQFSQRHLTEARYSTDNMSEADITDGLGQYFGTGGSVFRGMMSSSLAVRRESLAWENAKERAREELMSAAQNSASFAELEAEAARIRAKSTSNESQVSRYSSNEVRLPADAPFLSQEKRYAPLQSIEEWCTLPTRPIIAPEGKPEGGSEGLASFLFDNIIYAPQVCDRRGQHVGLSPEVRAAHIQKIRHAIETGTPVMASEYIPLVAIGNPIKRNTQSPTLADVDFFRRLREISQAVELFYEPGMQWLIGNEAPAFQGPEFQIPDSYVQSFHDQCESIVRQIDPDGHSLRLFNLATVLTGTEEATSLWENYRRAKSDELFEAYSNPDHSGHKEVVQHLNTFTYPMATCINPYRFESASDLSCDAIAQVYAALKNKLGSNIRGVGASAEENTSLDDLTPQQTALLDDLEQWGRKLTFTYRTVMDSRASLPMFNDIIPPHTLAHTIVTKRDKLVLYPNSGRGAYFPAHGEAVHQRSRAPGQRSSVTVRPWWHIAAAPHKYQPVYLAGANEPFYFEEV